MGAYRNAMEMLVEEEVEKQVKALPARSTAYINRLELVAYALNQLPSLYATSEKGFEHQVHRGRSKFGEQIIQAVRRALAAIRRDPLRTYAPLQNHQSAPLREVLHELRLLLNNDKVDWDTLPKEVERALTTSHSRPRSHTPTQSHSQQQGMTWDARYEATPQSHPSRRSPIQPQSTYSRLRNFAIDPDPVSPLQTPLPPPPPRSKMPPVSEPRRNAMSRSEQAQSDAPPYGWDDPFYTM